jgi:hypothetical protein
MLWSAFHAFVKDILIPLASLGYIHSDICVGYDETSNVLYSSTEGIRMIDLDSICSLSGYIVSESAIKNERYIKTHHLGQREGIYDALVFVYAQVICVAESWLTQKRNEDVNANSLIRNSGRMSDPSLVDMELIEEVLVAYQGIFAREDERSLRLVEQRDDAEYFA